jgi:hypothetical protein
MPFRLMKEATINAKQAGERGISAKSVKKVAEVSNTKLFCYVFAMLMIPECRCRYRNSKAERLSGCDRDIMLAATYLEVLQNKVERLEGWLS